MCDADMLLEYGLVGAFDTVVNMMGEQVAVITGAQHAEEAADEDDDEMEFEGSTYAELQYHSQALATHLFYRFGVRQGGRVIIGTSGSTCAELVSMLACMRLGVSFVPIDLATTAPGRLADILTHCSPSAAVVVGRNDDDPAVRLLASVGCYRTALLTANGVLVEDAATVTSSLIDSLPTLCAASDSSACDACDELYVLFTSGSSGTPKGVRGTHRGLLNRLCWAYGRYPYGAHELALRRTPLTFIDSLAEIFAPLLAGIPIASQLMELFNTEGLLAVADAAQVMGVTRLTVIPSMLYQACRMDSSLGERWPCLEMVIVSGEDCAPALVALFAAVCPQARLVNLYGSTELAGDVTCADLTESADRVSIGTALSNNFLFLVQYDPDSGTVCFLSTISPEGVLSAADGTEGELMVIGEHVALGYCPETYNAHRFIANPFTQASAPIALSIELMQQIASYPMAFLTGDHVCLVDGVLLYRGRRDRMIKLAGQRVELDDMEGRLRALLQVADGIVLLPYDEGVVLVLDKDLLLAQGVLQAAGAGGTGTGASDREVLRRWLLHQTEGLLHSVLAHTVLLLLPAEAISRTSSYKIDRKQLSEHLATLIDQNRDTVPEAGPPSPILSSATNEQQAVEAHILSVMQEVLSITMTASDDFYSCGGDSVAAIELLWRLRPRYPALRIGHLRMTVEALARHLLAAVEEKLPDAKRPCLRAIDPLPVPPSVPRAAAAGDQKCVAAVSRTGISSEGLASAGPLTVRWKHRLLQCVDASPLVCSITTTSSPSPSTYIYIASHGGDVLCLEDHGTTSSVVWAMQTGQHIESALAVSAALGLVYVCSYQGTDIHAQTQGTQSEHCGSVWAMDMFTGAVAWSAQHAVECKASPVVMDDGSAVLVADYAGQVVKYSNGQRVHTFAAQGAVYASLVVADDQVIIATTKGMVYRLTKDLLLLDQYDCQTPIFSTPLPVGDGVICAGTDGSMRRLRWSTGIEVVWEEFPGGGPFFSSACRSQEELLIGCHDGTFRAISIATGAVQGALPLQTALFASPFLLGQQHAICASTAGDVYLIKGMEAVSSLRLPAEIFSSPVAQGGVVYIGCRDDHLYCLAL